MSAHLGKLQDDFIWGMRYNNPHCWRTGGAGVDQKAPYGPAAVEYADVKGIKRVRSGIWWLMRESPNLELKNLWWRRERNVRQRLVRFHEERPLKGHSYRWWHLENTFCHLTRLIRCFRSSLIFYWLNIIADIILTFKPRVHQCFPLRKNQFMELQLS